MIVQWIAAGGGGDVYAAYDPELDRKVAIKVMGVNRSASDRADPRRLLLREAQTLAQLSHPNVVTIFDVGAFGDTLAAPEGEAAGVFIVMEYVHGRSIAQWTAEALRPTHEVLEVFVPAGRGLAAAHSRGIVHRDFKPSNVMIGTDGRVRVLDFGLARAFDDSFTQKRSPEARELSEASGPSDTSMTVTGVLKGTPMYMAPEQHRGETATPKSDQYAFCAALYHVLLGTPAFEGNSLRELELRKATGVPELPANRDRLRPWLFEILRTGMNPDPEQRFADMSALLSALANNPQHRRRRYARAAGAAALLGSLSWAGYTAWNHQQLRCQRESEAALVNVWAPPIEAAVGADSHGPAALAAWQVARKRLDTFAQKWVHARTRVCESSIAGEVGLSNTSGVMLCLDRALVALDAVIEVLGTANHQAWEHAAQIVESLPDIAACTSSLSNDDSLHDSNLEPIEKAVAQGKALLSAGEYDQAARALAQAAAMAKTAGATRLQAVATTELGAAQHMRNQFGRSEASFREALALAIEVDDLRTTIRSLVGTIHILGSHQDKLAEAVKLATIARAYLDRRPYIDSQNVMMELHLARAHLDAGNHQEGLEHVRTARELVDGIDELPSVRIYLHLTIAATLFDAKQYDDALLHYEVALEETRRSRGEGHPMYGRILASMGTANLNLDRPEEGLKQLRQALAIAEQNHEPLAIPGRLYRKLGHASRRLKRWNEAIQYADRARILFLQGEGPTSTDTIEATIELSKAHRNGGDPGDAWQLLESVDVDPLKAGDRAAIEHERGHVLQKMGRFSAAARAFERAAIAFPEGHRDRACNEKGLREVDLRLPRAERPSPAG